MVDRDVFDMEEEELEKWTTWFQSEPRKFQADSEHRLTNRTRYSPVSKPSASYNGVLCARYTGSGCASWIDAVYLAVLK